MRATSKRRKKTWVPHHGFGYTAGLEATMKAQGLLDQGTGATYQALTDQGLLERRYGDLYTPIAGHPFAPLEVRLSELGWELAKFGKKALSRHQTD